MEDTRSEAGEGPGLCGRQEGHLVPGAAQFADCVAGLDITHCRVQHHLFSSQQGFRIDRGSRAAGVSYARQARAACTSC